MARSHIAPEPYLATRQSKVRQALAEKKQQALLVTNFKDVSYLTGFEGDDSFAVLTPDRLILVSDTRYEEQIQREAPGVEVIIRKKGMSDALVKLLKKLKLPRLAVEAESMTLRFREALGKELTKARIKTRLAPVEDIVVDVRNIKDAREVQIIEEAIAIAEHGFNTLKANMRVGMTENEIASLLVHEMRKRGAWNSSFDVIVGAGPNGSLPHYRPADYKIQSNMPVLVDWGALVRGYRSDLTRMILIGSIPPAIKEIYHVVLEAQLAAIAAIKPGRTGKQIDKIARDVIDKAGFGDKFGHGLGHGLGRDIHETLSFGKLSKTKLVPGMVMTVEPGIYLPGVGGVRIEDDILVTETGCRVLSHLPKDYESAKL
jgi:Xaa-Pro aminopeptidase